MQKNLFSTYLGGTELWILGNSMLVLRKVKQLLSNFEAERWENLSNLRLAKKSVAYKKNSSVQCVRTWIYWVGCRRDCLDEPVLINLCRLSLTCKNCVSDQTFSHAVTRQISPQCAPQNSRPSNRSSPSSRKGMSSQSPSVSTASSHTRYAQWHTHYYQDLKIVLFLFMWNDP